MTQKPSLLFLGHTYPYPPDGGVWVRSYHVMRLLAKEFDVTALCFERTGKAGSTGYADAEGAYQDPSAFAKVEVFEVPQQHSRIRFVWDHLRSVATHRVYSNYLFDSADFRRRMQEPLAKRNFRVVHADSIDLCRLFPLCEGVPVVCTHHNVESELLLRRAAAEDSAAKRAYIGYQGRRMQDAERFWGPRVALNVTVSERDAKQLAGAAPGGRYQVVPNGVDTEYHTVAADNPDGGVVFCGGMTWFPNRDALEWFCADVLPLLRPALGTRPVRWVGVATPEDIESYRSRFGVELTGWVPDVRPYLREAACFVVPIRVGGGSRLKILDAWSTGKAIVSTSVGCEGLSARHGENILIADTAQAFADEVKRVLTDAALRRRLGQGGRVVAETENSWRVIGEGMNRLYRGIAGA